MMTPGMTLQTKRENKRTPPPATVDGGQTSATDSRVSRAPTVNLTVNRLTRIDKAKIGHAARPRDLHPPAPRDLLIVSLTMVSSMPDWGGPRQALLTT